MLCASERLCGNIDRVSESTLIERLRLTLETNSGALHEIDEYGETLLYHAIWNIRSFAFCKLLIDHNSYLVKISGGGALPIHSACSIVRRDPDLIKLLVHHYPESVSIADSRGQYPLQLFLTREDIIDLEILRCLLSHNKGVVSRPYEGDLPLHIVTKKCNLVVVKEVFNAYPQAVYNENEDGETPLDMARSLYRENYTSVLLCIWRRTIGYISIIS